MAATNATTDPPRMPSQKEADIQMMLAADVHLGTNLCNNQMERYILNRRDDGIYIINLEKTWEKLQEAARAIAAIEHPFLEIVVQFAWPPRQTERALLEFTHAIAGRPPPDFLTYLSEVSRRHHVLDDLLILIDPRTDDPHYMAADSGRIRIIAFCNTDSPVRDVVEIVIPANNKGEHSKGCLFRLLARMVSDMRGTIHPGHMVDPLFYRELDEFKQQEEEEAPTDYYYFSLMQVDSFLYREPNEAEQQEEATDPEDN